jgi:hypothetical protein
MGDKCKTVSNHVKVIRWYNHDKMSLEDLPDLMLSSAAAHFLKCSASAVRVWADTGRLPVVLISGGVRVFRRSDLEAFAAARAVRLPRRRR